ncbi:MAG: hypothetical protein H6625_09485 [Bdellovibrionaceae bacterium]|nr:hypothetical protein [Pseudobdellovibrionaceae bacterium]
MKHLHYFYFLTWLLAPSFVYAENKFEVFIEIGSVWQNRNDIQIPPDTGTRFDIDQIDEGPFFHYRIESHYRFNKNHALRFVYAPFFVEVTGRADRDVFFKDQNFSNSEDLTINYQFNSYRLGYIYGFRGFDRDQINLGITTKIRDAKTTFSQSGRSSSYDNVGFVPLLYFEYQKALNSNWNLNFTVDGAAASQGRAIDAALKARYLIVEGLSLGIGLRSLEGGAENKKVFTFSWFNYALLDLKASF